MRRLVLVFILFPLLSIAKPRSCNWLFVYYMPYDNNMTALGAPIIDMIQKGITSNKVIATVQGDFSDSGMKRYLILKDTVLTYDIGGEGSAMTRSYQEYLDWVKTVATGRLRAVVFLDHGGSLDELGYDETPTSKFLRVDSLRTVLENFNRQTKHVTDLLYLQVCAKGSIEPLYELRNTARYTMASQNVLGAPNHYYERLFNDLSGSTSTEIEVARKLVDYERADMFYSVTCVNNSEFPQTQKLFASFLSTISQHVQLPVLPLMLSYYKQTYWDLVSFLNALVLDNDIQKLARQNLVDQIEKKLIVFHKKNERNETMEGYSGLSLVLMPTEKAKAFSHLEFFKDFKTPDLADRMRKGNSAMAVAVQRGHQKKVVADTFSVFPSPVIRWIKPESGQTTFLPSEDRVSVKALIESSDSLKSVKLSLFDFERDAVTVTQSPPIGDNTFQFSVDRNILMPTGGGELEIMAETVRGKVSTSRRVFVPAPRWDWDSYPARTDYALIFVTDEYDNWSPLVNPVFDGRTLADKLKSEYGMQTEVIENAPKQVVVEKLREYTRRHYGLDDQLFIFFAGHGYYDPLEHEGFVVPRDARRAQEGTESMIPYDRLRIMLDNQPCHHVFVALDVCFGGTFDQMIATRSADPGDLYDDAEKRDFIRRKLVHKSRLFLTSGGKEYIPDGIAGRHSPFAARLLKALESRGGKDGLLTSTELYSFMETLKIEPRFGTFGDHDVGGDFLFIVK